MNALAEKIEELISIGFNSRTESDHTQWRKRVVQFLTRAVSVADASDFVEITHPSWIDERASQVGMLEGLVQKTLRQSDAAAASVSPAVPVAQALLSKRVFVVHGHDNEAKETVARFIERLGLEPLILHEQPSSGRTV